jgi:hypothetical protein
VSGLCPGIQEHDDTSKEAVMEPFDPWTWRDPAVLVSGYDRPDERAGGTPDTADDSDFDRPEADPGSLDLVGYRVEAVDGGIGSIDEAGDEVDARYFIVDTGTWIFGRKVLLPEYDPDTFASPEYRQQVGAYYTDSYRTR